MTGRRSGRRPGPTGTRDDIILAARRQFAEHGYHGAGMRAIAQAAGVDTALIHRFFGSKEGLFAAAVSGGLGLTDLVDQVLAPEAGQIGERLVRGYLARWDDPARNAPLLAVVRSAASHDEAARVLRDLIGVRVAGRLVAAIGPPEPELRATLIGAALVGLAMFRSVIGIEPLASMDPDLIVGALGPEIDRYLDGSVGVSGTGPPVSR